MGKGGETSRAGAAVLGRCGLRKLLAETRRGRPQHPTSSTEPAPALEPAEDERRGGRRWPGGRHQLLPARRPLQQAARPALPQPRRLRHRVGRPARRLEGPGGPQVPAGAAAGQIADFGMSKWRVISMSQSRSETSLPEGGTIIYMPPEDYNPSQKTRASVKHDIYSYAIIMWEVMSRKQPFEEVINPLQIMYSVSQGQRLDLSEESLSMDIPHRAFVIRLIVSGWAQNPDERPSFLKCLIDLEPVLRTFDEIAMLEAVILLKRSKSRYESQCIHKSGKKTDVEKTSLNIPLNPQEETGSASIHCDALPLRSISPDISRLKSIPKYNILSSDGDSGSLHSLSCQSVDENLSVTQSAKLFVHPYSYLPSSDKSISVPSNSSSSVLRTSPIPSDFVLETMQQNVAHQWIQSKREEIIDQMTEACLNQSLDALLSRFLLMKEDYELISTKPTRTSKVRQLLDTSDSHGEEFSRIIIQKLKDNKQLGLQPYPDIVSNSLRLHL